MPETLLVERRGDGVALVTMNRPEKRNAMNRAFFDEFVATLSELDADPAVRACVITGAGVAFSAGGDFNAFHALRTTADARRHARAALHAFEAIERCELVTIAAVNGLAYGGGLELTLACDLALASTAARFAFREVSVGLMPAYGLVRGPVTIGAPQTRRLALTGDIVDAGEALRIGIVGQVCEPPELLTAALGVGARIAANPPIAVAVGKQFLNRDTPRVNEAIEATALLFSTDDHRELISAFLERR